MALKKSDRQLIDEGFVVLVEHFKHGKEECYESAECECEEGEAINLAGDALARLDRESDSLREQVRTLTARAVNAETHLGEANATKADMLVALDALREQVETLTAERDAAQQREKELQRDLDAMLYAVGAKKEAP